MAEENKNEKKSKKKLDKEKEKKERLAQFEKDKKQAQKVLLTLGNQDVMDEDLDDDETKETFRSMNKKTKNRLIRDMAVRDTAFTSEKAAIHISPQVFPTEKEPFYHKNIRIKKCTFKTDCPVEARLTDNIVFKDNVNEDGRPMTLKLTNCGSVDAPGCTIERYTEKVEELSMN